MATNVQINVGANTSAAERAVEALFKKDYNLNVNVKGGQPLGRITGDLSEFNKSMDAANARVIAFGASASVIMGIQKAFHALIDSTIEVQKALTEVQVVLNVNDREIAKFGNSLFNVAKQTGQSFQEVATAATEFSRQGLGMQETLKRTSDALILSRLSGMGAAQSVQALTAAINSFSSQAVTASDVVNKFANVDTAFAVSSKDLAEGVSRVGSSAAQAGISLDQLIALVTAAQVATARGGAVIGNSFKTIFTRLDRSKTQDLLESLGISTTDASGKIRGTIDLLQDLARVYDTLSRPQQAQVAEKVGGVFQINILKATLADLNKEYSVYKQAVEISSTSTDEAIQRNQALNQTYAAQLNALKQNATQLSATAGEKLFGPSLSRLVGGGNSVLGSINEADANSYGAKLASGILSGLGQFLAGPGLGLIGGVLIKLFADFSKYIGTGAKELLGLNTAAKEQADLQKSITEILSKDPSIYKQIESGAMSVNDITKSLLGNLKLQTVELELQAKLSKEIAAAAYGGGARVVGGVARTTKAAGYIPNFASDEDMEEMQARMLGARNPRAVESRGTIGGKKFIMNSEEDEIPNFGSNGDSAVIPRYADGWIPNFAGRPAKRKRVSDVSAAENREKRKAAGGIVDLGFTDAISLIYAKKEGVSKVSGVYSDKETGAQYKLGFNKGGLTLPVNPDEANLERNVAEDLVSLTNSYINTLGGAGKNISSISQFANAGALGGIIGNIFETAVTYATGSEGFSRQGGQSALVDFPAPNSKLRTLFGGMPGQYEAKYVDSQNLINDVARKAIVGGLVKRRQADGYIPELQDSIAREIGAGAPKSGIYVKQYSDLANSDNPMGLGVFNSRDEGSPSKEQSAIRKKGYAAGYIPNFAEGGSGTGATIGAVATELGGMALMLAFSSNGIREEYGKQIQILRNANGGIVNATDKLKTGLVAGASNIGLAVSTIIPMITSTIGSNIDKSTQSGRVKSAELSALGSTASFAGTGAMIGTAIAPGIGTAVGAGAGALLGGIMGLIDVMKQNNTILPELIAKNKELSEKASKDDEGFQNIIKIAEQLKDLKGQNKPENTPKIIDLETQLNTGISQYEGNVSKDTLSQLNSGSAESFKNAVNERAAANVSQKYDIQEQQATTKQYELFKGSDIGNFDKNKAIEMAKSAASMTEMEVSRFSPQSRQEKIDLLKQRASGLETDLKDRTKPLNAIAMEQGVSPAVVVEASRESSARQEKFYAEILNEKIAKDKEIIQALQKSLDADLNGAATEQEKNRINKNYSQALNKYTNMLDAAIKNTQQASTFATESTGFKQEFGRGRNQAQASALSEMGFSGEAEKINVQNIYDEATKGQGESALKINEAIQQTILKAADVSNAAVSSLPLEERGGALQKLGGENNKVNSNFYKQVTKTSEEISGFSTNKIEGLYGGTAQTVNINDILKKVQEQPSFQQAYGAKGAINEEGKKELDNLSAIIQNGQKEQVNVQKELAAAAARKVDELIKVSIQTYNKFGGTASSLLDNERPNKISETVEDAVGNLNLILKDKASGVDVARGNLGVLKSVSELTGGMPTVDVDNPMMKGLIDGLKEGITTQLDRSEAALRKIPNGGIEMASAVESNLFKLTGVSENGPGAREQAISEVAKFKAAQEVGGVAAGTSTTVGQNMYQQQVETTLKQLENQGEKGKALAEAYKNTAHGVDPTTDAIYSLQQVYSDLATKQLSALDRMAAYFGEKVPEKEKTSGQIKNEQTKGEAAGNTNVSVNIKVSSEDQAKHLAALSSKDLEDHIKEFYNRLGRVEDTAQMLSKATTAPSTPPPKVYV